MLREPVWPLRPNGRCPLDLDAEHDLQWRALFDSMAMGDVERVNALLWGPGNLELDRRKYLMLSAILDEDPERRGGPIVEPDILEFALLEIVGHYRQVGTQWPPELQLMALQADAWLRQVGEVRERWRLTCRLLGIELAEAMDGPVRRWWWPSEVPDVSTYDAHVRPRPLVYLPSWPGELDRYGIGEGWAPGELLIVSAPLVHAAMYPPVEPVEPPLMHGPPEPEPAEPEPAAEEPALRRYVDEGLKGLDDFLRRGWR